MIYQILPSQKYLDEVAKIILDIYGDDLSDIRVILPNSILVSRLQECIMRITQKESMILPYSIPIEALTKESVVLYRLNQTSINTPSYLEQKLILMKVIENYHDSDLFRCNIIQAEYLSRGMISMFTEIIASELDINNLRDIASYDAASHWLKSSNFLLYSFNEYSRYLEKHNKIDPNELHKRILDQELLSLSEQKLVLVGIMPNSKAMSRLINMISKSTSSIYILPPYLANSDNSEYYNPSVIISDIISNCKIDEKHILKTQVIKDSRVIKDIQKIEYITTDTLLEEAETVAKIAIYESKDNDVAIVISDSRFKDLCSIYLSKYGATYSDLYGKSILDSKEIEFILLVADVAFTKSVAKFIALLKTCYLSSKEAYILEIKYLRDAITLSDVKIDDNEMYNYFNRLMHIIDRLSQYNNIASFSDILATHIQCVYEINNAAFASERISNFFQNLTSVAKIIDNISIEFYVSFLQSLLKDAKYAQKTDAKITLINAQDAAFIDINIVIVTNCNEGNFPEGRSQSPWLSNKMRKSFGLSCELDKIKINHYYFYLLTNKERVYITRSKKAYSGDTVVSRFLTSMQMRDDDCKWHRKLSSKCNSWLHDTTDCNILKNQDNNQLTKFTFPNTISVTDVELLIRNPYGFFAKKILHLRPLSIIDQQLSSKDFGIVIHNIIGEYTQNYKKGYGYDEFVYIGNKIFQEYGLYNKRDSWWDKFLVIGKDFIKFDNKRRMNASNIYAEIYGDMKLNICDTEINITCIADRVEKLNDRTICIIDYKTGIVPSKQDVHQGISPQLIIEALIALSGGFRAIGAVDIIQELIYVKISSMSDMSKEQTIITQNTDELMMHKQNLINLLEYYMIRSNEFISKPNRDIAPKYDDYKHLARKLLL